jgi:hemerythrin-like domain-containing protein
MKCEPTMPRVLERLFAEHRYLSALARLLEAKSSQRVPLRVADYYLLRDVVGYMHDYPDHVHHPTEDLLFERVIQKRPSLKKIVKRLRRDHEEGATETQQLLCQLDELINRPDAELSRVVVNGCKVMARRQRSHMRLENQEAFPAAIATLSEADWQKIETHFLTAEDPLFGKTVSSRHRLLYEYLLDFADGGDHKSAIAQLFSLERFVQTGEVLAKGAGEGWTCLARLRDAVAAETLSALRQRRRLPATVQLPTKYLLSVGRSLSDCGADLVKIWAATARGALALYASRGMPE